jgi:hypothetical protein
MHEYPCDRCPTKTRAPSRELAPVSFIERGADTTMLCRSCAGPISNLIDQYLADGMVRLSPIGRCARCRKATHPGTATTFRLSPWRRYEFCDDCCTPLLDAVAGQHLP